MSEEVKRVLVVLGLVLLAVVVLASNVVYYRWLRS